MKLLKKLLRRLYHLIAFLSLFLIFISPVNAVAGNPNTNGTEFSTAIGATFLDNTNGNLTTVTTNWNNTGKYYVADNLTLNGASTSGANLNIKLLEPVVNGYTYILSVLVGAPVFLKTSDSKFCIAENLSNNVERWNRNMCVNTFYRDFATGANFNVVDSSYSNTIGYTVLYYGFTANVTASSVMFVFQSQQSMSSSVIFGGYKLELVSDNKQLTQQQITSAVQSSGLATANSVSQVQQGINEVKSSLNSLNQTQQETNNTIKDETAPTVDLSDVNLTSTTPISDLLTLPLSLLNSYLTAFSGTCTNYVLPLPFNHSITLPCFTLSDVIGSNVAYIVDMAICLFMAYEIVLLFIKIFEDMTSLSDTYTNWVKRGRY